MRLKKVLNEMNLVRDVDSKAVISTDGDAYNKYIEQRERFIRQKEELLNLRTELNDVKQTMLAIMEKLEKRNGN